MSLVGATFIVIVLLAPASLFAQVISYGPRDNAILTNLNELQDREDALKKAMQEAQMKLLDKGTLEQEEFQEEPLPKKGFYFPDIIPQAHPYLTLSTRFNDNIDSSPTHKKTSVIYSAIPGVQMNFLGRRKFLNLDMSVTNEYWSNRKRESSQDLAAKALVGLGVGRYTLSIADTYTSNFLESSRFAREAEETGKFWRNGLSTTFGSHFNRIGFDVTAARSDVDYESDFSENDSFTETYSLKQYLRIATKTRLLLGYSHSRSKPKHEEDTPQGSRSNSFDATLTGVLSPKVSGSFQVSRQETDNKSEEDSNDLTFRTDLGYRMTERLDLSFNFSHLIHDPQTKSAYYLEDAISASMNYRPAFNRRLKLSPTYSVTMQKFPKVSEETEKTNTYSAGLGLSYTFKRWLDCSLDYAYEKVVGNQGGEHEKNRVTLKTLARF